MFLKCCKLFFNDMKCVNCRIGRLDRRIEINENNFKIKVFFLILDVVLYKLHERFEGIRGVTFFFILKIKMDSPM